MLTSLTYRRHDGTFVAVVNGAPYHIISSDQMFADAQAIAAEMGDALAFEPLPPPAMPVIPREVTNFQARALLMNMPGSAAGRSLFQDVDDTLRALGGVEWQAWEYTTIFPRNSQLIATLGAQLGLTDAQLDQMFIAAAAISA